MGRSWNRLTCWAVLGRLGDGFFLEAIQMKDMAMRTVTMYLSAGSIGRASLGKGGGW